MGKKQKNNNESLMPSRIGNRVITLRDENLGIKKVDATSLVHIQHIQRLATWASGEAGVCPLGALLGRQLAGSTEASGVPIDSSIILCKKCETILQPAYNCSVRIKVKRSLKKAKTDCANNVVYSCHFCYHDNIIHGASKGHLKRLLAENRNIKSLYNGSSIVKSATSDVIVKDNHCVGIVVSVLSDLQNLGFLHQDVNYEASKITTGNVDATILNSSTMKAKEVDIVTELINSTYNSSEGNHAREISVSAASAAENDEPTKIGRVVEQSCPVPERKLQNELYDSRNLMTPLEKHASEKAANVSSSRATCKDESGNTDSMKGSSSKKRRRKGWTSLKEISQRDEQERKKKISNFVIPFKL